MKLSSLSSIHQSRRGANRWLPLVWLALALQWSAPMAMASVLVGEGGYCIYQPGSPTTTSASGHLTTASVPVDADHCPACLVYSAGHIIDSEPGYLNFTVVQNSSLWPSAHSPLTANLLGTANRPRAPPQL